MKPRSGEYILHIGANHGHEVEEYERLGLYGFHVEAIPDVFEELDKKCQTTIRQKAICACVSDRSGSKVAFNVATNNAESSSMLPLGRHKIAYPHIAYGQTIELTTTTVDNLTDTGSIPPPSHIVIDVQGAEMLVLKGAEKTLSSNKLKTIKVEASLEPLYEGGASFRVVFKHLDKFGFYLRDANFNFHGWCDATFSKKWWPDQEFRLEGERGINIATCASCTQSSFSQWSTGPKESQNAVIGPATGSYSFHTKEEINPWIQLDFEEIRELKEIVIYNRITDGFCVAQRANSLRVLLSTNAKDWETVYEAKGNVFGGIDGDPLIVNSQGKQAKHIKLELIVATPQALHLDLIEVYT